MTFRNLTENHDWTFGSGLQNYTSGNQAIGIDIKTRLLSWIGDCFFAENEGIDWKNRIGSKNQRNLLENDIRRIILKTQGVTELLSFDTILNDRNFTASYSINTIFSQEYIDTLTLRI
ncbi:MAG: hypothetical protein COB09_19115 [Thalassobium sp.]|nr:MAG: hypothetical protein COB09_19115 [Thalassobium sp.]